MPELEKLLDEWTEKHSKLLSQEEPYSIDHEAPYGRFVRDGVVNMDEWKKQKLRVCMLLPEASGFEDLEKHPDTPDVAAEWNAKGSFTAMMLMLATWARAVQDSVLAPAPYPKKSIHKHKNELIRSIAVVNLKKSDGHLEINPDIVKKFARADAAEIRKELEIIKANVIIVDQFYHATLIGERPENEEPDAPRKFVFYSDELVKGGSRVYKWGKNKLILMLWSPSQKFKPSSSKLINYYSVREICRAGIKSFQEPEQKPKKAKAKKAEQAVEQQTQPAEATEQTKPAENVEPTEQVQPAEPAETKTKAKKTATKTKAKAKTETETAE